MQPTMKLRWRLAEHGEQCVPFGHKWTAGMSDELDRYEGRVLQQWWEEVKFSLFQQPPIPTGKGEWRDIEMQEPEIEEE